MLAVVLWVEVVLPPFAFKTLEVPKVLTHTFGLNGNRVLSRRLLACLFRVRTVSRCCRNEVIRYALDSMPAFVSPLAEPHMPLGRDFSIQRLSWVLLVSTKVWTRRCRPLVLCPFHVDTKLRLDGVDGKLLRRCVINRATSTFGANFNSCAPVANVRMAAA